MSSQSPQQQQQQILFSPITPFSGNDAFPEQQQESKWKERNDRQLRLWGVNGQERIDNANVCLLNATSVGAETLKNIVLPGFGKITVVDGQKVSPADLGVNFFVDMDGMDGSRAKNVMQNLVELNEQNVTGNYLEASPATMINDDPDFLDRQQFNYIIASNLDPVTLRKVAQYCWSKNKVLVIVRSYGFIGYVRVITRVHDVIEAKPEQEKDDLRMQDPFEKLAKFCDVQNFDQMTPEQVRNTPYPVILIRFLQEWKKNHEGKLPTTKDEREQYKASINDFHMKYVIANDPEQKTMRNFEEAVSKCHVAYLPYEIPDTVHEILSDPLVNNLTKDSSDFCFLAAALKRFVANEGKGTLPCQGRVPDMDADTQRYVKLQSIYRRKAREDAETINAHLKQLYQETGRAGPEIAESTVIEFCKNAFYLRLFKYRSYEEELTAPNKEEVQSKLFEDSNSPAILYLGLLAVDRFYEKHGHYPGDDGKPEMDNDIAELKSILAQIVKEYEIAEDQFDVDAYAKEITRYGASEMHNISSLVGGVAAQELIKLCTRQRLPLNKTWVFNGVTCSSASFTA